ncbi:hypothetical protein HQ529_03695 [Candidatus Woesearchaeota archaeon]|nr:hypothetical protein [Candidatus Woesearchaeota archaeon]
MAKKFLIHRQQFINVIVNIVHGNVILHMAMLEITIQIGRGVKKKELVNNAVRSLLYIHRCVQEIFVVMNVWITRGKEGFCMYVKFVTKNLSLFYPDQNEVIDAVHMNVQWN